MFFRSISINDIIISFNTGKNLKKSIINLYMHWCINLYDGDIERISAVVNINSLERDGLRQAELCPRHTMKMNTKNTLIPDRSQPGITMTAPTVRHPDVGDEYATGVPKIKKIRGRENIAVGTWNVRTLRPAGKLEQLTHAISRYHWNIVGLCEMRWKNFGEM